jgi:hypothetical protein
VPCMDTGFRVFYTSCTYRKQEGKVDKGFVQNPCMSHTMRINKAQLTLGTRIEAKEHTWASMRIARRIARDHIRESPMAYVGKRKP